MEGKLSELRESPKQDKARPHIPLGLAWEQGLTEGPGGCPTNITVKGPNGE